MRRRQTEKALVPLRVLMALDTIGGVWRFGLDLARALAPRNVSFVFVTLGPAPTEVQRQEAEALGKLVHLPLPLDWLAASENELSDVPSRIAETAAQHEVDLIQLNMPTQAAGLETDKPIIVMSHSCVPTWFQAVRKTAPPEDREWHVRLNRKGISRADVVLVPSRSHGELMVATYGQIRNLRVVHEATGAALHAADRAAREGIVAVGRWWDEAKNGVVLDAAAGLMSSTLTMVGNTTGPNGESFTIRNAVPAGPLAHADTLALVGKAEAFVSSSLYEPFGLAVLEAAACRTPLILADIPAYRELWDGGALFVPPCEPAAYAEAVEKLRQERQLREILAQLASNRATRFTPARQATAMRAVYDSLALPAMRMTAS